MRKYKVWLTSFVLCFAGYAASAQSQPFKAEIKLMRTEVSNNQTFTVMTAIRNTGTSVQSLYIWPCTYPLQWVADNPAIRVNGVTCAKNSLVTIKLKPGEAYTGALQVHVDLPFNEVKPENVAFRLEYGTTTPNGVWKPWPDIPPIWSNAVTVVVTGKGAN